MEAVRPTDRQTVAALIAIRDALGQPAAYWFEGRFHFPLGGSWTLALSPESAGRFQVACCRSGRLVASMWSLADDQDRLADLARAARSEVLALSAAA